MTGWKVLFNQVFSQSISQLVCCLNGIATTLTIEKYLAVTNSYNVENMLSCERYTVKIMHDSLIKKTDVLM